MNNLVQLVISDLGDTILDSGIYLSDLQFRMRGTVGTAKIVGGAMMFEDCEKHAIGKRNVTQARAEHSKFKIPVIAEDVFGNWGRSILFKLENGEVTVRSFKHGEKTL